MVRRIVGKIFNVFNSNVSVRTVHILKNDKSCLKVTLKNIW